MAATLLDGYDAVLLDLDGTVYQGDVAIPGAAKAVRAIRSAGHRVRFVTNNASRRPGEVADHLRRLDFDCALDEISTSAQAAAGFLAEQLPAGSPVLVVGTEALAEEISNRGLTPVRTADKSPVAVVQGHSPDTGWRELSEACLAIKSGARWVACNVDNTLPTERGLVPGNGSMVAALRAATGIEPEVTGKPARRLLDDATRSAGAQRPLVVGDRLDTDIAGAVAAGADSLLVLTGVSTPADLLLAQPDSRPTYLAAELSALHASPESSAIGAEVVPGWRTAVRGGIVELFAVDGSAGNAMAAVRALCARFWVAADRPRGVLAGDDTARETLAELGIATG